MKDAYYFPHDSNARNDIKMIKFRAKHGYEGYGIFWAIIEVLREQSEWKLEFDSIDVLSIAIGIDTNRLNEIVADLLEIKLLKKSGNYIVSESLTRRMQYFEERKNIYRNNGKKGGRPKANEKQNESYLKPTGYNLLKQNESKTKAVNISKVNKVNKNGFFSFFSDKYGIEKDAIFRNGTNLIQKKIFVWHIFESLNYDKPICAKYFDKIHERNFCDNKGDPYTVDMLVSEILYYHKRGWLKGDMDEQDTV